MGVHVIKPRATHSARLNEARERTLETPDGVTLCYEVLGLDEPGAETIVLANGLGGRLYAWEPLVERFAATHRLVTWDYRGLFRSTAPARRKGLGITHHAADAVRVLEAEGIEAATFVGWSMGVQVSLEAALEYPERVQRLVLINGTYGQVFRTGLQPVLRLASVHRVLHGLVERLTDGSRLLDAVAWVARSRPVVASTGGVAALWARDRRVLDMYRQYIHDVFGESRYNYLRLFQELDAHSVYHHLPELAQPALIVSGGLDWLTPSAMSAEMARRIPRAEHLHLRLASHFALLERPDRVLDAMAAFLGKR